MTRDEKQSGCDNLSGNERAKREGFAISHAAGCPGVHFPGVGVVWDDGLPEAAKHAFLDLLAGRHFFR